MPPSSVCPVTTGLKVCCLAGKKPWTAVVSGWDSWKGSNLNQSPVFPSPRRSRCVVGVSSDDRCRYFPFAGWIVNGDERRRLMHPLLSEEKSFTSLSQSIKLMRRRNLGSADATRRWRAEGLVKSVDAAVLNKARGLYVHSSVLQCGKLQPAKSDFFKWVLEKLVSCLQPASCCNASCSRHCGGMMTADVVWFSFWRSQCGQHVVSEKDIWASESDFLSWIH